MREVRAHRRSKKLKQIIEPVIEEGGDEDEDEEPESYDYDNLHLANKFEDLQIFLIEILCILNLRQC